MSHGRTGVDAAVLLPDGRVLVAGGGSLATAELYDFTAGTWTNTGALAGNRFVHSGTLLGNGKVLVAGGLTGTNNQQRFYLLHSP